MAEQPGRVTALDTVLYDWMQKWEFVGSPREQEQLADLRARLISREDGIADLLRLAGAQLGAMPQLVAEVICLTGLGTTPTDEERALIHRQYEAAIEQLQEEIRRMRGDDN